MTYQKQKRPTIAGSGISKNIHLDQANDVYFNMIMENTECARFCCDVLRNFDELLNKYWIGDPCIEESNRIRLYLALSQMDKGGAK
jgi:hypothetical protein